MNKFKIGFLVLIVLVVFGTCGVGAEKTYGNVVVSRVVSVYDGDTLDVDIDSWPEIIGKSVGVRIRGIDTPEMKDDRPEIKKKANEAKERVISLVANAKKVELKNIGRDKYFRILADVYADGKLISDILIKEGLAKKYDGGTKEAW